MTNGTSQGLFVIVAVVIFGIFVGISYLLFQDKMQTGLSTIFDNSISNVALERKLNPSKIEDFDKPTSDLNMSHDLNSFGIQSMNDYSNQSYSFEKNNNSFVSEIIDVDVENTALEYYLNSASVYYDYMPNDSFNKSKYFSNNKDNSVFEEMVSKIIDKGENVSLNNILRAQSNKNISSAYDLMLYYSKTNINTLDANYRNLDYNKDTRGVSYNLINFTGDYDYIKVNGVNYTGNIEDLYGLGADNDIQIQYSLKFYNYSDIKFIYNYRTI